uniref:Uncharacterized protein n=1 Tax=Arundo donax TaxID=35708 RepID=A0A0A9DKS0_ARUDO
MRPDQPDGAGTARAPPGWSSNPVGSSRGLPALDRMPGHTVSVHRFTNVNVAASPSLQETKNKSTRTVMDLGNSIDAS